MCFCYWIIAVLSEDIQTPSVCNKISYSLCNPIIPVFHTSIFNWKTSFENPHTTTTFHIISLKCHNMTKCLPGSAVSLYQKLSKLKLKTQRTSIQIWVWEEPAGSILPEIAGSRFLLDKLNNFIPDYMPSQPRWVSVMWHLTFNSYQLLLTAKIGRQSISFCKFIYFVES